MNSKKMPELKIDGLKIRTPIIQGGMSVGVSLAGLAAAVAKEGGIGVIGTAGIGMLEPDFNVNYRGTNRRALLSEIKKAKELSNGGIIGVNIMLALTDADDLIVDSIDGGADLIFLGAGLPIKNAKTFPIDRIKQSAIKIVPIVSSYRAVKIIFQYWAKEYNYIPDAVVVEGPLAGGHLGFKKEQIDDPDYALEKIFPEVLEVIKPYEKQFNKNIPVMAAGGIYTGADIYKFMQMGAQGVQMATRFVATHECDASIKFKEMYVNSTKEDLIIIKSPVGLPGRAIKNQFIKDVLAGERKPFDCPFKCLKTCNFTEAPYCIALALVNAKLGKIEEGFTFAGANAYRIDKIVHVKEIIETLLEEYERAASA